MPGKSSGCTRFFPSISTKAGSGAPSRRQILSHSRFNEPSGIALHVPPKRRALIPLLRQLLEIELGAEAVAVGGAEARLPDVHGGQGALLPDPLGRELAGLDRVRQVRGELH